MSDMQEEQANEWSLMSLNALKLTASYFRCVSCAVLASDRTVRAMVELNGPFHESNFTPPDASKVFIRDSEYSGEIRDHPIQFKYDDDHTEYAECVLDVDDVQRVKLVVWWLQVVAVRSLYLLGTHELTQYGVQHVLSMLLNEDALTTTGKPLPTVLEELVFSTWFWSGYGDESFDLPVQCQHLRKLHMKDYPLSSLDGIEKLAALEVLHIDCRHIHNLDPLAACTRLQKLVLEDCHKIESLDGLQYLSDLTHLTVTYMKMIDLKQFKSLIQLRRLDLSFCDELRSLEGVESLTQLRELVLHRCSKLHSLEGLEHLRALRILDLTCTKISDLKPLNECVRLEKLFLAGCEELCSLEGLEGLISLTDLSPSWTKVHDLTPLTGCVRMKELSLQWCSGVRSVAALSGMTSLEILNLNKTSVDDVAPLAGCVQMKRLSLHGCSGVRNIASLLGMTSLEILDLNNTSVDDVTPLASLPALTSLNLTGTSVRDLTPLQHRIDEGQLRVVGFKDSETGGRGGGRGN